MDVLDSVFERFIASPSRLRQYASPGTYGDRRARIGQWAFDLGYQLSIENREQLRRAFDAHCGIEPDPSDKTFSKYAHIPDYIPPEHLRPKPKPKRSSSMERNLPALLRSDAKTVQVKLPGTGKLYTYVTHLPVAVGDFVVVDAESQIRIAQVMVVDNEAKIEPGSDAEYKWVIDTVDMAAYEANQKRNSDIQAEAATIIRGNLRRSFAQQVLGAASDGQREKLLVLTGNMAS